MDTILVVENEPMELAVLVETLRDEDFDLLTARDGVEAQELLKQEVPGLKLIILDWTMPRMDGIELLGWIKQQPGLKSIEVVMQSGRIAPEDVEQGLNAGACFYLTKPYEPYQLCAVVKAALANSNLKRSLQEKIQQAQDTFRLLVEGLFLVRTYKEAESLSARIAVTCGYSESGIGLFEILANAIEHGNLGITYDDKSRLLKADQFEEEIERRLQLPENRDKRVRVELKRSPREMKVKIIDAGPGFDFGKYTEFDPGRMFDPHGRGILVAKSLLELKYLEPGNAVEVRIPIQQDRSPV